MKTLTLIAALALCAAGSPLAAQARTASIGVSATVAAPLRADVPAGVALDFRQGRYLDVTAPASVSGADAYLVDVVVTRAGDDAAGAPGAPSAPAPRAGAAPAARLQGNNGRFRFDLRDGNLPDGESVRVTYVIAANL